MKNLRLVLIALCTLAVFSCQTDKSSGASDDGATETESTRSEADPNGLPPASNLFEGAESVETIPHYICPKGCAGSGGSASGTCPVCGSAYQHNDAFHAAPQGADPTAAPTPPPPAEPAQNAKGVWHYTCPKGCAGGAGTQGNCSSCGTALSHNANYHNP